ncbi:LOW QUALITY PROTEIN: hypothetical protein QC762_0082910 [Podospora pseudocomata]|uniref:Kinesin light chain n=1 Tax=Podospora pseudocomata TaxID=2093779 RepID=A0ABR0GCD1_9PEZI|nr:LOW QUALITY PROTEIN: hypothetical protein QC762_0082910 [Podospora pseudocomata]
MPTSDLRLDPRGYKTHKWLDLDATYLIVKPKFSLRFRHADELRIESAMSDSYRFGDYNNGSQVGTNRGTIYNTFPQAPERSETPPRPFATIPFSRDPDFVNRGDILEQIDRRCSEPAARVALVGLGGIGKSQLAIEFAHRITEKQPDIWVFWVHAGMYERVEDGFRTIANTVKLAGRNEPKANIPQLLAFQRTERQMDHDPDSADDRDVFDNANIAHGTTSGNERERRPFATYLPQSQNGSIIVTTRNRELAFRLTGRRQNMIEVGPMAQTDALALLEKKLGSPADLDVAADLVQALDLVPLAISQAAAYIQARAPRSSPEKYLAEFRKSEHRKSSLLQYDAGDLRRDGGASNAVLTTWQISFDYIRSKRPSAADLLSLMSFFDRQGIPGWVLKPPRVTKEDIPGRRIDEDRDTNFNNGRSATDSAVDDDMDSDTDSDLTDDSADITDDGFEDDVAMLRDYCLIATTEMDEFEMHGLVQFSTRKWLEQWGQQETFKQKFIERMAASFPTGNYKNWATCRNLFAHVQVAVAYQPSDDRNDIWATLLYNGGWFAWSQGRYEVAQRMVGKARRARENRLGKEDTASLDSMSLFALVLLDRGQWEEAEKLFVQVMETSKTKLGADHPDTLSSMANLASTYRNQGRWEEAEKLFIQVMETSKTKLGADHPSTLTSMANLASTFWNQGRWEEAEKLEVQVMETRKTKLGADHPDTLTSMANLASTFWNQGRWEETEKLEVQVMETRKTKLGADHPDTLTSMANLASTYKNQGRWEEAEKLEVQVIETRKTKLGADHPSTLTSMANLASTYRNQGRWEEAEKLEVQVMETSKTKLGADHPSTLTSMANLASTYRNQGRWEEAEKLFVQVMETSKTKLGADHPSTLSSMANLASTFWNQGRWEEAEKLEVQVMETRKTKLGANHPDTLSSMANLAFTWKSQGRHSTALALMKDCAQARQRRLGAEHPDTLSSLATVIKWGS